MMESGSGGDADDKDRSGDGVGRSRGEEEEEQEWEAKEVEVEAEDNDGGSQLNGDRQNSKLVATKTHPSDGGSSFEERRSSFEERRRATTSSASARRTGAYSVSSDRTSFDDRLRAKLTREETPSSARDSFDDRLAHKLRRDGPRTISSLTASFDSSRDDFCSRPGSNDAHPPASPTERTELRPPAQVGQTILEDSGEVPAAQVEVPRSSTDRACLGTQIQSNSDDDSAERGTTDQACLGTQVQTNSDGDSAERGTAEVAHQSPPASVEGHDVEEAGAVRTSVTWGDDVAAEMTAHSEQNDTSTIDSEGSGVRRPSGRVSFGSQFGRQIVGRRRNTIRQFLHRDNEGTGGQRSGIMNWFQNTVRLNRLNTYDSSNPIQATLVLEASVRLAEPVEVYEANEVSFFERKWAGLIAMPCIVFLVAALVTTAILLLTGSNETTIDDTLQPTLSPTIDTRPTLEVIQTRPSSSRRLRCGYGRYGATGTLQMCSALAAVVLGDPEAFELVEFDAETRWTELDERRIDLIDDAIHSIQREVREVGTRFQGTTF